MSAAPDWFFTSLPVGSVASIFPAPHTVEFNRSVTLSMAEHAPAAPNKPLIMAGAMTALFLAAIDQTIVATALPHIVAEFQGLSHLSWVFTAYMLAATVSGPIAGKMSDLFGRRSVFIVAAVVFIAASILAGTAQDMTQLILYRGLQGIGAGALMVNTLAIPGDLFSLAERGRWMGLLGAVYGISSVAGPLLGGWITDQLSWRWIFYVNVPVGAVAIGMILYAFPRSLAPTRKPAIDYAGAVLLTVGLVPLLLAFVWGGVEYPWASAQILGLLATGVVGLALFVFVESRAAEPILAPSLFTNRTFAVMAVATLLSGMGMFAAILFIPVFGQGVAGFSATSSGLVLTPMALGMVSAAALTGQGIARTHQYRIFGIVGMAVLAAGLYLLSTMTPEVSHSGLIGRMVITGVGLGVTFPVFLIAVQNAFDQSKLGTVTASVQMFRTIGGTLGTALFGGMMNHSLTDSLSGMGNDPVLQQLARAGGQAAQFATLSVNAVQNILSVNGQAAVRGLVTRVPEAQRAEVAAQVEHFLGAIKAGFTAAVDDVFFAAMIAAAVGAVATLALPQLALRAGNAPGRPADGTAPAAAAAAPPRA